jgi:hypothetical protein
MLDNSEIVRNFVPEHDDGDTYVYSELLDRSKTKGNNGFRIVGAASLTSSFRPFGGSVT